MKRSWENLEQSNEGNLKYSLLSIAMASYMADLFSKWSLKNFSCCTSELLKDVTMTWPWMHIIINCWLAITYLISYMNMITTVTSKHALITFIALQIVLHYVLQLLLSSPRPFFRNGAYNLQSISVTPEKRVWGTRLGMRQFCWQNYWNNRKAKAKSKMLV